MPEHQVVCLRQIQPGHRLDSGLSPLDDGEHRPAQEPADESADIPVAGPSENHGGPHKNIPDSVFLKFFSAHRLVLRQIGIPVTLGIHNGAGHHDGSPHRGGPGNRVCQRLDLALRRNMKHHIAALCSLCKKIDIRNIALGELQIQRGVLKHGTIGSLPDHHPDFSRIMFPAEHVVKRTAACTSQSCNQ